MKRENHRTVNIGGGPGSRVLARARGGPQRPQRRGRKKWRRRRRGLGFGGVSWRKRRRHWMSSGLGVLKPSHELAEDRHVAGVRGGEGERERTAATTRTSVWWGFMAERGGGHWRSSGFSSSRRTATSSESVAVGERERGRGRRRWLGFDGV